MAHCICMCSFEHHRHRFTRARVALPLYRIHPHNAQIRTRFTPDTHIPHLCGREKSVTQGNSQICAPWPTDGSIQSAWSLSRAVDPFILQHGGLRKGIAEGSKTSTRCSSNIVRESGASKWPMQGPCIGVGVHGRVYRARHRATGDVVALKKVCVADKDSGVAIAALREISVLRELNAPCFIRLLDGERLLVIVL